MQRRALPLALLASVLALSCAAPPPPPPPPPFDAGELALRLEARTQLTEATRVMFDWSLADRDARFRGRGVARVEPPYQARLDLFLASGETAVRAALVNDDLRLPPGAPEGLVPPAELLWGALGVFRPSWDARLRGGETLPDGRQALLYVHPDGLEVRWVIGAGGVEEIERLRNGQVLERVVLAPVPGEPYPREATYRHLAAFRELQLVRQRVEHVENYPPDIWEIGR